MKTKLNYLNEMELMILSVWAGVWTKAGAILSSIWGWISSGIIALLGYFVGLKPLITVLLIIIAADFIIGILAAIKRNEKITSEKLRKTIIKTLIYMIILSLAYAIEIGIGFGNIVCKVLFGLAAVIELYSVTANALIIAPNMPFLKLFTHLVSGEISKKLELDRDKVDEVLKGKK